MSGLASHLSLIHKHVDENGSAAMLVVKRSAGVAPEVNLGKCTLHIPPPTANNKAANFETQTKCHQKSRAGVSVAPQKDMCPSTFFKKMFNSQKK